MHWPLAKVIRLIPERMARQNCGTEDSHYGTMLRPIQRVYHGSCRSAKLILIFGLDCTISNPISSISGDNLSDLTAHSNVLPGIPRKSLFLLDYFISRTFLLY
ncbi:hypothetical protein TNCV_3937691 [Trichonephila clavipes]|nr:hypothetical protein TNCV_3937691 [Trichonephila clavipes]